MQDEHSTWHTYELEYADLRHDKLCFVELRAPNMADALSQAQRLAIPGREATLKLDGEKVAELTYSSEGFWSVS